MKRTLVMLTVVALMMVMLAMSVAPASADKPYWSCTRYSDGYTFVVGSAKLAKADERAGIADCVPVHVTH